MPRINFVEDCNYLVYLAIVLDEEETKVAKKSIYENNDFYNDENCVENNQFVRIHKAERNSNILNVPQLFDIQNNNKDKLKIITDIATKILNSKRCMFAECYKGNSYLISQIDVKNEIKTIDKFKDKPFVNMEDIEQLFDFDQLEVEEINEIKLACNYFYRIKVVKCLKDYIELIESFDKYSWAIWLKSLYEVLEQEIKFYINKDDCENISKANELMDINFYLYFRICMALKTNHISNEADLQFKKEMDSFIKKINDFYHVLNTKYGRPDLNLNPYYAILYRGIDETIYKEIPKLFRKKSFYLNEDKMINEYAETFEKKLKNFTDFEKLSDMQHYGLPTRFLDVTRNKFVALYMACRNKHEKIGEVICYYPTPFGDDEFHRNNISRHLLMQLTKLNNKEKEYLDFVTKYYFANKESKHEIERLINNGDYFNFGNNLSNDDVEQIINIFKRIKYNLKDVLKDRWNYLDFNQLINAAYVLPGYVNDRMIAQKGNFIMFGLYKEFAPLNCISTRNMICLSRIFVTNKIGILKELDHLGINEKTMFPDEEHIAHYIQEKYDY